MTTKTRAEGKQAWTPGAPTSRGLYWINWDRTGGGVLTAVIAVDVSPALLYMSDHNARLLLKMLGGNAVDLELNASRILHHMPMTAPEQP